MANTWNNSKKSENNLSKFYKNANISAELYHSGQIVNLKTYSVKNPNNTIVALFNHGTRNYKKVQTCKPTRNGYILDDIQNTEISNKEVVVFHLCSYSTGNYAGRLTPKRAEEIELSVEYFLKLGILPQNIFIFGHSRGGWSTLYFAAKNKKHKLGGHIIFAPAICGPRPLSCINVINKHISLFKSSQIDGILFSHKKDRFFRPEEHKFAKEVQGLKLRTNFCEGLSTKKAHFFYSKNCSYELLEEVKEFISKRSNPK